MQKRDISGSVMGIVAKAYSVFYNQPRTVTESSLYVAVILACEVRYGETGNIGRIKRIVG